MQPLGDIPTEPQPSASPSGPLCAQSSSFPAQPPPQGFPASQETLPQPQKQSRTSHFSNVFPPWQLANSLPGFSSNLDNISAENPWCSPPPRAQQSRGRDGSTGTPCWIASDFPPKYGMGKRLQGCGCDLHTALLSSAISLKNQPFNCGHISTSPNLLIIDSW